MPTVCVLDGIAIRVNTRDHPPPHFHAYFGGYQVRIDIATLAIMTGGLPRPKLRLLLRWAAVHQAELQRNWDLALAGKPHQPISPELGVAG